MTCPAETLANNRKPNEIDRKPNERISRKIPQKRIKKLLDGIENALKVRVEKIDATQSSIMRKTIVDSNKIFIIDVTANAAKFEREDNSKIPIKTRRTKDKLLIVELNFNMEIPVTTAVNRKKL